MDIRPTGQGHLKAFWRALVEVLFITIWAALRDIFNGATCTIALVSSVIGYLGFQYVRKRL